MKKSMAEFSDFYRVTGFLGYGQSGLVYKVVPKRNAEHKYCGGVFPLHANVAYAAKCYYSLEGYVVRV